MDSLIEELVAAYEENDRAFRSPKVLEVLEGFHGHALLAMKLIQRGHTELGEEVSALPLHTQNDGLSEVDPSTPVHVVLADDAGFDGQVTGELCPNSGAYTTTGELRKFLTSL